MTLNQEQRSIIEGAVRDIPDFPKPGIVFKDITTILNNAEAYVDFDISWSRRLNLNLYYSKQGIEKSTYRINVPITGVFSLGEKWKISYNTGNDSEDQSFKRTSL